MTAICQGCGENVELGDALREGVEVLCPSCGTVIVRGRRSKASKTGASADVNAEAPQYPDWELSPPEKKKLAVRRPASEPSNAQNRYGGLYDPEKRAKMYDEMKHRLWVRKFLKNAFDAGIILGTLFAMWFIYKAWDSHLEHKREIAAAERAAEDAREAERSRLRQEELDRERLRAEAERAALRAEREREEESKRLAEQKRRETIDEFKMFTYALRENDFDMFSKSVTNCLAAAGGALCYLLPETESVPVLYLAESQTNGVISVLRINENGERESIDGASFFDRIRLLDYIVAGEGKVYYHARRKNALWGKLSKTTPCDPAKVFFAGLHEKLEHLKPTYDEIKFDIVFIPKNSQKQIVCETLEYGCTYSLDNVRDAVESAFPPKNLGGTAFKAKQYKRTVKLWNGSHIKEGVDGITYVPRVPPSSNTKNVYYGPGYYEFRHRVIYRSEVRRQDNRERWQSLYNQAVQEEREEEEYYRRQKEDFTNRRQRAMSEADRAYEAKIDKMISEGELYYHARRNKATANQATQR